MEQISSLTPKQSQQIVEERIRDASPWQAFFKECNPSEKKQFLSNMQRHFSQMIWRQMRKSKEALRKLRESHHSR